MRYQSPTQLSLRQHGILSPFPVSPKGKPGRGRFPPRRKLRASPRKRGFQSTPLKSPCAIPLAGLTCGRIQFTKQLAGMSAGTVTSSGPGDGSIGRF
jgi:hypothetical protein